MAAIRIEHVSHRYGQVEVLRDVTVEFAERSITAIIGRSGSGKSTLLRCMNGMVVPTDGRVLLFDAPIEYANIHEVRRKIGYAVQGTGLFPHLTVRDNIGILGRVTHMPAAALDERIGRLMVMVDLDPAFARKYPHELSGGEQQRVGLCRAMLLNPPIFLLDEPFGALDPATRSELHREFLKLQREEPRTIVFVTHDMDEARTLADRVVEMQNGSVL